ncbi:hypothetical protein [Aliihoeflea sp. 2WW]|uniref:hypothetical protein n=1 Tax=Aliihoeflea sp. 2WW TaxID=1381123 RepID=UPI0012690D07|nr:hypothetical protein [Aliihoeflea sp. 2WW]
MEARVRDFERNFQRASKTANDNFAGIERRAKQSGERMESAMSGSASRLSRNMESMFAPFMRGGVVFAGVAGATMAVKQIASSIAEVDREARKAGVTAQVWQRWTYVAAATGATIDGVTDALKELNIRGDEFAKTGKGGGAEWFMRLGYTAEEVGKKLQDPSRFLDEIIGKLQTLDRASQTRALDEIFGGTGAEQMAKVLGLSVTEIQKLRGEAATFTDEQIAAAKKIDAEFQTLWRNVQVYSKQAAIDGVGYARKIIGALRGEWLPGYEAGEDAYARLISPENQLAAATRNRDAILDQIKALEDGPDFATRGMELRILRGHLQAAEEQVTSLGEAVTELAPITVEAGTAFDSTSTQALNFRNALNDLKNLVPELKAELDQLGKLDAVDAAFRQAAGNARTMSELMGAVDIAGRAKSIATYGSHNNMLDLIGAAEGTDKGRGYNETLGYGAYTGGARNLTGMTLDQIDAMQTQMLRHPKNSFNSSAAGRYQIVQKTLRGLRSELGLSGDRLFDEATQDELARALLRRRGNDVAGLRNEWEGLRNVDAGTIQQAYGGTPVAAQKLAPTEGQQKAIDLANQQTEARKSLNQAIQQGLELAQFEQQISGLSAQQRQIELALFQYQQDAKRNGLTLSDQELVQMREKITLTQQLSNETVAAANTAQGMAQAQDYFAQSFTSALTGLATGTTTLEQVLQQLLNSLIQVTLQAALLGQGPLAGVFGTAGGGGLLGSFFGGLKLASGGHVRGPGTSTSDSIPAMLSDGEYVVNAKATRQHGALLEAINSGGVRGFAAGGPVGGNSYIGAPSTRNTTYAPNITINQQSSGDPRMDREHAEATANTIRAMVQSEIAETMTNEMRPQGSIARKRFSS